MKSEKRVWKEEGGSRGGRELEMMKKRKNYPGSFVIVIPAAKAVGLA